MEWGSNLQELAVSALAICFARVGFFCGTAGAMANEIGIPFAGVQVLCGGASSVASEVWVQSAGVGPTFCVTGCTSNISGVLSDFSGTTTFFKDFAGAPSGLAVTLFFFMYDAQEQHLSGKTWYDDRWNMY